MIHRAAAQGCVVRLGLCRGHGVQAGVLDVMWCRSLAGCWCRGVQREFSTDSLFMLFCAPNYATAGLSAPLLTYFCPPQKEKTHNPVFVSVIYVGAGN